MQKFQRVQVGAVLVGDDGSVIGRITDSYSEDGRSYFVIDGDFELPIPAGSLEEHINLTTGSTFYKFRSAGSIAIF